MSSPALALRDPVLTNLRNAQDRRTSYRVQVALSGRYMLEDKQEYHCTTIDMSLTGVSLKASAQGVIGQRVIVYLDTIGRLEGRITRHHWDGFALEFNVPPAKRERLAEQLTWLANRAILGIPEGRRYDRLIPKQQDAIVRLESGREVPCQIIDVSLSGAGIRVAAPMPMGSLATLGNTTGRVVRQFDGGVALQFVRLLPVEKFEADIVL